MNKGIKLIVIAIVALVSFAVVGSEQKEQLESFCGITFGKKPLKKHTFIGRMDNGVRVYKFKPKKPFMKFTHYTYGASPITNTIFMVDIRKKFESRSTCDFNFQKIATALEAKYKVTPHKKREVLSEYYLFDIGKTQIRLSSTIGFMEYTISIMCFDVPLFEKANTEIKEFAIKDTDTSAL